MKQILALSLVTIALLDALSGCAGLRNPIDIIREANDQSESVGSFTYDGKTTYVDRDNNGNLSAVTIP